MEKMRPHFFQRRGEWWACPMKLQASMAGLAWEGSERLPVAASRPKFEGVGGRPSQRYQVPVPVPVWGWRPEAAGRGGGGAATDCSSRTSRSITWRVARHRARRQLRSLALDHDYSRLHARVGGGHRRGVAVTGAVWSAATDARPTTPPAAAERGVRRGSPLENLPWAHRTCAKRRQRRRRGTRGR